MAGSAGILACMNAPGVQIVLRKIRLNFIKLAYDACAVAAGRDACAPGEKAAFA